MATLDLSPEMLEHDDCADLLESEMWDHKGQQPTEGIRPDFEVVERPLGFEPWVAPCPAAFPD